MEGNQDDVVPALKKLSSPCLKRKNMALNGICKRHTKTAFEKEKTKFDKRKVKAMHRGFRGRGEKKLFNVFFFSSSSPH